jgi:meso-butanediol dehydrogenase / (S,S)-butanediol dehydrogenase / diacetyl reductase
MTVKQKSVLVTGASQGIGRGIALRLAQDGANLALVDIKADKLERVAREIEALGRKATTFVADVSNRDEVYAAVDHAEKALGGFDVMVNNAGIAQVKPLTDVQPEDLDRCPSSKHLAQVWRGVNGERASSGVGF